MTSIRPLRVGVFFPQQAQTIGGGFTFEHTIFTEILSKLPDSSQSSRIKYIPITSSVDDCDSWNVDPQLCLVTDSDILVWPAFHKRVYRRLLREWKSSSYLAKQAQKRRELLIRASVDAVWSLSPSVGACNVPYIVTVWDLQHRLQPFFPEVSQIGAWSWQAREAHYQTIAAQAFACVVGTRRGGAELMHFFGIDPERIIINPFPCPSPIDKNESLQTSTLKRLGLIDGQYLLYPAQFWSHKNHVCALYALKSLVVQGRPLKLVLTGSDYGSFKAIKDKAIEIGVDANVVMPGFVSRNELAQLYSRSCALIYPSFFGPDNIPPLEAMSYGTPALVASVPGAREQYGETVLFFNPEKPEQLADLVVQLIENPALRSSLRDKGYQLIAGLTPSNYVGRVEAFLLSSRMALECCSL
jgi:glycosyltransferase involved in cell wall biosynthesis